MMLFKRVALIMLLLLSVLDLRGVIAEGVMAE